MSHDVLAPRTTGRTDHDVRRDDAGHDRSVAGGPAPRSRWWIWGFLAAFAVHDGEEVFAVWRGTGSTVFGHPETPLQSTAGIVLEGTLVWVLVLLSARAMRPGLPVRAFATVVAGWLLHGIGHLAAAVPASGYAFGAVTAMPCAVVYGAFCLRALRADGLLDRRWLLFAVLAGAPAAAPLVVLGHVWGWVTV